ncbi:hypothetical protein [Deinococcus sp.]|uniref:hypothetical protein n=1 Tax=Deinococcus sp. TaxID=47478 RepID=UPI0025BE23B3|nr:hypothetical protein [Deinococcus sp.]
MQAVAALTAVVASVTPKAAQLAAAPALAKQIKFVNSAPPAGLSQQYRSWSAYFAYLKFKDARVDVENLRGHNLRT